MIVPLVCQQSPFFAMDSCSERLSHACSVSNQEMTAAQGWLPWFVLSAPIFDRLGPVSHRRASSIAGTTRAIDTP